MSGILDLLGGSELMNGISKETGVNSDQVSSVMQLALPALMGAMQKNSQDESAASGLLNALQSDKHDGSLLNNLGSLLSGGNSGALLSDGAGILGHLLGGDQNKVADAISAKTGVSSSGVSQILKMAAPFLMSYLGKQVTDKNVTSTSGLTSVLSSVLGGNAGGASNLLTSLLDADKDGSILDDVAGMFLGKNNPLGGLFGGK